MTEPRKSLSRVKKVLLGIGAFVVLMGFIGAISPQEEKKQLNATTTKTNSGQVKGDTAKEERAKQPVVEIKTIQEVVTVPYESVTQNDPTTLKGQTSILPGINGEKVISYKVTYTDGKETKREPVGEKITKQPVSQVTKIGTEVAAQPKPSNCHPNYTGCVPIASDVDCAGGSGNGPAYLSGTVQVIGADVYGLDHDNDGAACE